VYEESKLPIAERVRQNRVVDSVLLKAKWAHDHIGDLDRALEEFFDTRPYVVSPKKNAETGEAVYYYSGCSPFPIAIHGHVGDALYNLRSALDHLAWQLVIANGKTPGTGTGFPIFDPSAKDSKSLFNRKVNGIRDETVEAIARLKPYKGGDNSLWLLHQLNGIDKHHEVLGIGTSHIGQTHLPSVQKEIEANWLRMHPQGDPAFISSIMVPTPTVKVLEVGDVLRIVPEAEYDPNMQLQFDVTFAVPGKAPVKSALDLLIEMERVVIKIISDFRTNGHFRIGP
jgi:hypothetical protein